VEVDPLQYWRLVLHRAWRLSREHFAWWPAILLFGIAWGIRVYLKVGSIWEDALVSAVASVSVAVLFYVVNLLRGAVEIHRDNVQAIARLQREPDELLDHGTNLTVSVSNDDEHVFADVTNQGRETAEVYGFVEAHGHVEWHHKQVRARWDHAQNEARLPVSPQMSHRFRIARRLMQASCWRWGVIGVTDNGLSERLNTDSQTEWHIDVTIVVQAEPPLRTGRIVRGVRLRWDGTWTEITD
jgi:hypothetical protein